MEVYILNTMSYKWINYLSIICQHIIFYKKNKLIFC